MEAISAKYREHLMKMLAKSRAQLEVGEHNVYQVGNEEILPFIDRIIEEHLLPGSGIRDLDRLEALFEAAQAGEPCLLLLEHYSNFDLPVLHYLLRKEGERGKAIADALVAIAGIKLSEESPVVAAFSEAYTRLVIYPSRSIEALKEGKHHDPKEIVAEMMKSVMINRQSMKRLSTLKTEGKLVLVFPAGTRYRPWDPATGKGVREIDSYIKSFSKMCLVSINGNILRISQSKDMIDDLLCKDRVIYDVSEPMACEDFRAKVKHEHHHMTEDKKQAVADAIMAGLARLHGEVESSLPPITATS
ncbi:MAG: 1-acyl-sn-glycerol-3-phosphate acyltransferase [Treponema sp.]|nr:1-acyl-sn-glycerol-3-phosphate acyltransferase [Treponema sp.]